MSAARGAGGGAAPAPVGADQRAKGQRLLADVLAEAQAIEAAGGNWQARHVAAIVSVSERMVYALAGLPRVELPGTGDRPMVRYRPEQVRAWNAARLSHSVIRAESAA